MWKVGKVQVRAMLSLAGDNFIVLLQFVHRNEYYIYLSDSSDAIATLVYCHFWGLPYLNIIEFSPDNL